MVVWDMGENPPIINKIAFNNNTKEILLYSNERNVEPKSANTIVDYERSGKENKILNRTPIPLKRFSFNPDEFLELFDLIYVIDTSTDMPKREISVSCVGKLELEKKLKDIFFDYSVVEIFSMWDVKEKAENLAWMVWIEKLLENPDYIRDLKLGIIVDSDLGNIENYNSRKTPIFDNFFLPPNIELIYASSDSGSREFIANAALKQTDKEAKRFLTYVLNNEKEIEDAESFNDKPYTRFKFINFTSSDDTTIVRL